MLALDIDDTSLGYGQQLIKYVNEIMGLNLSEESFISYGLDTSFGCTSQQARNLVQDFNHLYLEQIEPIEGAVEGNCYLPSVEHWNGYRIPRFEKLFETQKDLATISIADAKEDPLFRALCGNNEMASRYLEVIRKQGKTEMGLYFPKEEDKRFEFARPLFF